MSTVELTNDDIGKDVVAADGTDVGIVSGYRYGTAYVDPDPGLTTKLKTALGWEDTDEDEGYPLQEASIDSVTDDEIRLRSDL
ncbi:PRC-barrel domain containing protein [Halomicroarcula sp. F13]|uniref:PRC-barrel domain containing protein n=1 Tax=Haloarcula rubra TaxID=2487747 RepID=A0AAW4PLP4_9EURY|nr:PRC-barrel domain containing protein [Halomicroarcula rubra]MBX0322061.1 PRC-barrel domain containing protein [Halomicroarcula rubra]